jgi:predicted nucleic acid-binding protein
MKERRLLRQYKQLFHQIDVVKIIPMNEEIAELAGLLRGKYNLSAPDCIHLATAIDARSEFFISNDKSLKRIKEIKVATIEEIFKNIKI